PTPPGKKVVSARWLYNVKAYYRIKGPHCRERMMQVSGSGCGGTFAPVCTIQRICMVLVSAAERGWSAWQLDIRAAAIYAKVEVEV
ncbi:unnamed protein product, partial [Scytosiphon promiscuus]